MNLSKIIPLFLCLFITVTTSFMATAQTDSAKTNIPRVDTLLVQALNIADEIEQFLNENDTITAETRMVILEKLSNQYGLITESLIRLYPDSTFLSFSEFVKSYTLSQGSAKFLEIIAAYQDFYKSAAMKFTLADVPRAADVVNADSNIFDISASLVFGGANGLTENISFFPYYRLNFSLHPETTKKYLPKVVQVSFSGNALGRPALELAGKAVGFLTDASKLIPLQVYELPAVEQLWAASSLKSTISLGYNLVNPGKIGAYLLGHFTTSTAPVRLQAAEQVVQGVLNNVAENLTKGLYDATEIDAVRQLLDVAADLPVTKKIVNFKEKESNQTLMYIGMTLSGYVNCDNKVIFSAFVQPQVSLNPAKTSREVTSLSLDQEFIPDQAFANVLRDLNIDILNRKDIEPKEYQTAIIMPYGANLDIRLNDKTRLELSYYGVTSLFKNKNMESKILPDIIGLNRSNPGYVNLGFTYTLFALKKKPGSNVDTYKFNMF